MLPVEVPDTDTSETKSFSNDFQAEIRALRGQEGITSATRSVVQVDKLAPILQMGYAVVHKYQHSDVYSSTTSINEPAVVTPTTNSTSTEIGMASGTATRYVDATDTPSSTLSAGAKAGIAIGVIAAIALLGSLAFALIFLNRKSRKSRQSASANTEPMAAAMDLDYPVLAQMKPSAYYGQGKQELPGDASVPVDSTKPLVSSSRKAVPFSSTQKGQLSPQVSQKYRSYNSPSTDTGEASFGGVSPIQSPPPQEYEERPMSPRILSPVNEYLPEHEPQLPVYGPHQSVNEMPGGGGPPPPNTYEMPQSQYTAFDPEHPHGAQEMPLNGRQ
ncbi:hypothetical protein G7Y89_g9433 [Cudoniella acicularis]|uniref:Uncharacterized protein n=1 Tax=Cudoniella acicularis TaxID=354080 RepID=A0A8H4RIC8_9HELO|nr:hypothetical protein G7Y89_g9433 [Cudoniella acicularis]